MIRDEKKILIVDDITGNRSFLAGMLMYEYELLIARDGKEALATMAREDVDLILLGPGIPIMEGLEFCETLKANVEKGGVPIVFISDTEDEEKKSVVLSIGAADYLSKPVNTKILTKRIGGILGMEHE
jgi:putative two-component system response regulator